MPYQAIDAALVLFFGGAFVITGVLTYEIVCKMKGRRR